MKVPTYQIHKIIRVYIKQLTQSESAESDKKFEEKSSIDWIKINTKGKRRVIINKVADDIIQRITDFGPSDALDPEIVGGTEKEIGNKIDFHTMKKSEFVFNTINVRNEKIKNKIPVDDSRFLLGRVESLAKKADDSDMKS